MPPAPLEDMVVLLVPISVGFEELSSFSIGVLVAGLAWCDVSIPELKAVAAMELLACLSVIWSHEDIVPSFGKSLL